MDPQLKVSVIKFYFPEERINQIKATFYYATVTFNLQH